MSAPRLSKSLADAQSRFISDSKTRIGKCVTFGCSNDSQVTALGRILYRISRRWRRYAVGREGYNTESYDVGMYRQKIAWGDHDQMGHVNNVRYNFWAETGRINWLRNIARKADPAHRKAWEELYTSNGIGLILRSIKTDYKLPLQYPDRFTVCHRLLQVPQEGMDALHLEAVVLSETHQRIAARITEDIAVYDYRIKKRAPLPDFMVQTLLKIWQMQARTIGNVAKEISEMSEIIEQVEKQTWDRDDAVEDLGSATGLRNQ